LDAHFEFVKFDAVFNLFSRKISFGQPYQLIQSSLTVLNCA
jgi:hypothetical protein